MVSLVVRRVVRLVVSLVVRLVVRFHSPTLQPFLVSVGPAVETILVLKLARSNVLTTPASQAKEKLTTKDY